MTEQELFKKATDFYHQEGQELNAIEAFKDLLKLFPNNLDGWRHLATMQNKITDFDEAIKSINKAVQIAPNNSWTIQQKCTILSLISRFPSEGQMYFNEKTREAHEIKTYLSKKELQRDLDKSIFNVIQLEKENKRVNHQYSWKLVHSKFNLKEHEKAIDILSNLKNRIPENYNQDRRNRELQNIETHITKNLIGLKRYKEAIARLEEAMKNQDDNYFTGMTLIDVYTETKNEINREKVLVELLKSNDKKIKDKPELAFFSRKFEILKMLEMPNQMEEINRDFELIKNQNDYIFKRIIEIKEKIKNYRQQIYDGHAQ